MTQGRPKGSKAELEVAKIIGDWWCLYEPGTIFKRTPLSGGWGDKDAREAFRTAGDLVTSSTRFPFSVEVKRREGFAWKPFLAARKSPVWGWWRQAIDQAKEMRTTPLLWFRKNREPWHVLVPFAVFDACPPDMVRISHLVAAEQYFARSTIRADFGRIPPVMVGAEDFLRVGPARWEMACSGWSPR